MKADHILISSSVTDRNRKNRKPKICMLLTNPVTGDPRVRKEASSLVREGYEVTVIGAKDEKSSYSEELDGYRIIRVLTLRHIYERFLPLRKAILLRPGKEQHPVPFPTKLRGDVLNIASVIWLNLALARRAVIQKADVYHAHDLDALLAGSLAKWWTGKKLIYDFHELFTKQFKDGVKTKLWGVFYSLMERSLVKHADLRVTVCRSIGEWVTKHYGINGVVTIRNVPPMQTCAAVHSHGNRERVILYHGGFFRDRGLEQLIESARFLKSGTVMLRGYGNLEHRLRNLVREFGVEDRVKFAPPVVMSDLVKIASQADVGVIPYIPFCLNNHFCLPNKIFEYMMAGLAVVGSDLPELRNIILGLEIGAVFNPEAPHDIARAINEIMRDEDRLKRMKHNAYRAAHERYNWEQEAKALLKAYKILVET